MSQNLHDLKGLEDITYSCGSLTFFCYLSVIFSSIRVPLLKVRFLDICIFPGVVEYF